MTAQEFADQVNSGKSPVHWNWSDSTKEQYFNFLNAEQANESELNLWRLNNEYNSPEKQMERMVAAGINPAAAYQSVNSGNSGSPAQYHVPQTASWHDTTDKLAKINTVMSGISQFVGMAKNVIDMVGGAQDISITAQDNWLARGRAQLQGLPIYDEAAVKSLSNDLSFVNLGHGRYAMIDDLIKFPEAIKAYAAESSRELGFGHYANASDIAARRTRIDKLVQNIFNGLESGSKVSLHDMTRYFLELFSYGILGNFTKQ